jgi:tight adherence protein C
MDALLIGALVSVFVSVALLSGMVASRVLVWTTPELRRLREISAPRRTRAKAHTTLLEAAVPSSLAFLARALPKSPRDMGRLRRELSAAGRYDLSAAAYYSAAKVVVPLLFGGAALVLMGPAEGWLLALVGALVGYLVPDLVLIRMRRAHASAIENGLPDVLDLMIVCIEAGSSLDQSMVKASEDLGLAHPALARELRLVTTEIRAGKPRIEALRNLARRTQVEDVRALVTMLTQTDRFGTSVAQALRVHSQTSRTKRRQRAEERAAKIGVKLVFPLVLCIFPAVYVVCIGPAVVSIYRNLLQ